MAEIHWVKGTFKGSEKNGGRRIKVGHKKVDGKWKTVSTDAARFEYEQKHGKLDKNTDVDHKDSNKGHDALSNLQAMSHSKNVAKEDHLRKGKKHKK
jgi:hypothetical protein